MTNTKKPIKLLLLIALVAVPSAFAVWVPLAIRQSMSTAQHIPEFHAAAQDGNADILIQLLSSGHSVDEAMPAGNPLFVEGMTPLMVASRVGNLSTVQLLLQSDADVTRVDSEGKTALDYARQNGNRAIINVLMSNTPVAKAESMIEDGSIKTLGRDDLVASFGQPNADGYFSDWDNAFWLGTPEDTYGVDSKWLVVNYGEGGLVEEAKIAMD